MESIGYYVLIALLGAGAAYAFAGKGKPRPALTAKKRNLAILLFGIAFACMVLALLLALLPHNARAH